MAGAVATSILTARGANQSGRVSPVISAHVPTVVSGRRALPFPADASQAIIGSSPEEGNVMPVVRVSFYEGRSIEQKREIAEIITDALVRVAGSKREAVNMLFDNHAREDWVIGGAPEFRKSAEGD